MRSTKPFLLAALLLPTPVGAKMPQAAQAGRWQVDVAPARCRLTRNIPGTPPSAISIQTVPGSDDYALTLASPALGGFPTSKLVPATLTFADGSGAIQGRARGIRIDGDMTTAVRLSGLAPVLLERLGTNSTITLVRDAKDRFDFTIGETAKAVAALQRCSAEQLIAWGADAAQFSTGGTMPVALSSRDEWISNAQLIKIIAGRDRVESSFRVDVLPDGTVGPCEAIATETSAEVTRLACKAVAGRTLFRPATAPSGEAVRGVATFDIRLWSETNTTSGRQ